MRITGIIAEYNPFHNGHRYHLQKARALTEPDYVLAVMSGSFTQRGEPALMNKWKRAELAVKNGVNLVLELPFVFACSPAENFAGGSVDILAKAGATHICFGSENGDVRELTAAAEKLLRGSEEMNRLRSDIMKEGVSFARANHIAAEKKYGRDLSMLMESPNNILALEYIKRILFWQKHGKKIIPVTVKRSGSGYFESDPAAGFAGASVIRGMYAEGNDISGYVPLNVSQALDENKKFIPSEEILFQIVRAELIRNTPEHLAGICCVGEGLEHKLKKEAMKSNTLEELLSSAVSKRYTMSAIKRIMIYILLGIKKGFTLRDYYGRVLAADSSGRELIRIIKKNAAAEIPVITNINKEAHRFPKIHESLGYDMLAADMYNILSGRNLYDFSDRVIHSVHI